MRAVHIGLAALILAVFCVGWFEPRPRLKQDFDPARDAAAKPTWDRRVHLAYWEKWGSFEQEACQAMVDAFNASQEDIFVHYVNIGEIDRKAMLAIMGGESPDVLGLWSWAVAPFAEGNALRPLDELMAQSGLGRDHYIENYLKLGEYDGRVYALPTTPATVALFYNKAHFRRKADQLRAAGLDPDRGPATIDELTRYADVLTEFGPDGRPTVMGFSPTEPGWFHATWGYYFGGTLYDEQTGQITTDCPQNVRAFTWVKRFAERYGRERMLTFIGGFGSFDSPQNAFIDGKVSMEMQGVWFPNFIRRHRPDLEFGVVAFPTAEGVPGPRSVLEADVIGIPRGCPHPQEAWRFVHWVQTEGLAILDRQQGKHLPWRDTPPGFRDGHPNKELAIFEELAASPHSFRLPQIIVWREYRDEMDRAFQHIWNWPAPEGPLQGLDGEARWRKIEQLCQAEVEKTLREIRVKLQSKLDHQRQRRQMREDRP